MKGQRYVSKPRRRMNNTFCIELRAAYNLPMLNQVCQTVKLYGQKVRFLFRLSNA